MFHGHLRHDGIIFQNKDSYFFAKLHFVFTCSIQNQTYSLALVQSYKTPASPRSSDTELGLFRIKLKTPLSWDIISTNSIVRGAFIVDNPDDCREAFVLDTIDSDMYLRLKNNFF